MTEDFDVVVIGGGTAGICRANTAAIFGKRVALVEKLCEVGGSRNQHRNDPFGRTAGRFTKRSCACRDGGRDHGQRHSVPGSGSGLLGAGSSSQQRHRKQVWQCKTVSLLWRPQWRSSNRQFQRTLGRLAADLFDRLEARDRCAGKWLSRVRMPLRT